MKIMFGGLPVRFTARAGESTICSARAQLGKRQDAPAEAAARAVVLRNSLLVCLPIIFSLFISKGPALTGAGRAVTVPAVES
jgi:hypothetical protein